jgi:hypothetical protein
VLDDGDAAHVAAVEAAWQAGALGRALMDRPHAGRIKNLSSLAFGGPDRRTVYLGTLGGDSLPCFRLPADCPWTGAAPPHWNH